MKLHLLLIAYGVFLILIGIAGFASNPEKAKTALLSGGLFGSLSILWGVLLARGFAKARLIAFAMTCFLTLVFAWRSWVSWSAVAEGEPKHIAAVLISAMFVASVVMVPLLARTHRSGRVTG